MSLATYRIIRLFSSEFSFLSLTTHDRSFSLFTRFTYVQEILSLKIYFSTHNFLYNCSLQSVAHIRKRGRYYSTKTGQVQEEVLQVSLSDSQHQAMIGNHLDHTQTQLRLRFKPKTTDNPQRKSTDNLKCPSAQVNFNCYDMKVQ